MRRTFLEHFHVGTPDVIRVDRERIQYIAFTGSVIAIFAMSGARMHGHLLDVIAFAALVCHAGLFTRTSGSVDTQATFASRPFLRPSP